MSHNDNFCKIICSKSDNPLTQLRRTSDACLTRKKFVPLWTLRSGHSGQTVVGGIPTYLIL